MLQHHDLDEAQTTKSNVVNYYLQTFYLPHFLPFQLSLSPVKAYMLRDGESQVNFICIAQYHKSQFDSVGFTISTSYNTLCPYNLDSDK